MTYTPGPWWADGSDITTDDNLCVAVVQRPRIDDDGGYMSNDTANANARLIANAPSLVDALARCADWLGTLSNCKASDACLDSVRGLLFHVTGNGHYTPKEVSDG